MFIAGRYKRLHAVTSKAPMPGRKTKIGVVAPAGRIDEALAPRIAALAGGLYGDSVRIVFHPQGFLSDGHFAGADAARASAFLEIANDETFDALWLARGGYGSNRIADAVLAGLKPAARGKTYMGYSDIGFLLAALYKAGFPKLAHGPMPADLNRQGDHGAQGGPEAVTRALRYLVEGAADALETSVGKEGPAIAFNLKILSSLIGTPLQPDLSGHVLMLEDVSEHLYAIDRAMFHITSNPDIRKIKGIRLGRFSDIPDNDPPFGQSVEEIAKHWCALSGIAYLGRADIGHDTANKIVPFGHFTAV
jgi:muramoyltetrapeptide carboxypeptidase